LCDALFEQEKAQEKAYLTEGEEKNMKMWSLFFALALVFVVDSAHAQSVENPTAAAPALTLETPEIELGPVYIGEVHPVSFTFVNTGGAELTVEKIDSSCGCLIPEMYDAEYEPGKQGQLNVQFDPAQAGTTGHVKKDIIIYSNDPAHPRTIATIRAFIYATRNGVPYEPQDINLGDVVVNESARKSVSLYETAGSPLEIAKIEAPEGFEHAIRKADTGNEDKLLIEVWNKPTSAIGPMAGALEVHTNNEAQPVLRIPLSVNIIGEIKVEPSRLLFGLVDQNAVDKKTVRLTTAGESFKLLSVKSKPEFVLVEAPGDTADTEYLISITISDNAPSGRFSGNIVIATDNEYQQEISIPVFGVISESRVAE
jgi:hypothetical protein